MLRCVPGPPSTHSPKKANAQLLSLQNPKPVGRNVGAAVATVGEPVKQ